MELKDYQRRVLEKFDDYVSVLKAEQEKSAKAVATLKAAKVEIPQGLDDYPGNAWKALTSKGVLPRFRHAQHGLVVPPYVHRHDSRGRSVPHICLYKFIGRPGRRWRTVSILIGSRWSELPAGA